MFIQISTLLLICDDIPTFMRKREDWYESGADLGFFSRGGGGADFQKKIFENFDDLFF